MSAKKRKQGDELTDDNGIRYRQVSLAIDTLTMLWSFADQQGLIDPQLHMLDDVNELLCRCLVQMQNLTATINSAAEPGVDDRGEQICGVCDDQGGSFERLRLTENDLEGLQDKTVLADDVNKTPSSQPEGRDRCSIVPFDLLSPEFLRPPPPALGLHTAPETHPSQNDEALYNQTNNSRHPSHPLPPPVLLDATGARFPIDSHAVVVPEERVMQYQDRQFDNYNDLELAAGLALDDLHPQPSLPIHPFRVARRGSLATHRNVLSPTPTTSSSSYWDQFPGHPPQANSHNRIRKVTWSTMTPPMT